MKKIMAIFILAGILVGGYVGFREYTGAQEPADSGNIQEVELEIPAGSSTDQIAYLLAEEGLIKNETIFKYMAKLKGMDSQFKAGLYNLNNSMGMKEILDKLAKGGEDIGVYTFTIPEGYELRQIADQLSDDSIVDKEKFMEKALNVELYRDKYDFLDSVPEGGGLEGYLYPDTYQVDMGREDEEDIIIDMMLENFGVHYTKELMDKAEMLGLDTNQAITLSSIVEREAKVESERSTISAVFHNRIKDGMNLQSCATVQYILKERKEVLSYEDVEIESPYNTYLYSGLPPAPIASPGIASIEAALNPEDVSYLFFVAKGDGSHSFSDTYEDHLDAQNKNQN